MNEFSRKGQPISWLVVSLLVSLLFPLQLSAEIAATGEVSPSISSWNSGTWGIVGFTEGEIGHVKVDSGDDLFSRTVDLGYRPGSSGEVTVSGIGSTWTNYNKAPNSGELTIGRFGEGVVNIESGGQISSGTGYLGYNMGSTGMATVSGAGSRWLDVDNLYVGYQGDGLLSIEAGGQVSSTVGYVGFSSRATGSASVIGEGSKWINSSALFVGRPGLGALTVADGGEIETPQFNASLSCLFGNGTIHATQGGILDADLLFDASHGNQVALPFGSGGTLMLQADGGNLGAGYWQNGSLTITDGVEIASENGYLGIYSGSVGTGIVSGAGSTWSNGRVLDVGNAGTGTLAIEMGGRVTSSFGSIGSHTGSSGTVTVSGTGSQWTNANRMDVGERGNGFLTIEAAGQVSNTTGFIGRNSKSTGMVTVKGTDSTWNNIGGLTVGFDGNGTLNITGNGVVKVGGTLTIDFNSNGESSVNMSSGGMLALAGDAYDSLTQFLELVEGTDAIRFWNDSLGDWALLTSATYGVDYTLEYLTSGDLMGYTLLTVIAPGPAGDFNSDGMVDGRDFLAWQRGESLDPFGQADLEVWRSGFGGGASVTDGSVAVPEPGSAPLVGIAIVIAGAGWCRRLFPRPLVAESLLA